MTTYRYQFQKIDNPSDEKLNAFGAEGLRIVQYQNISETEALILLEETVYEDWELSFDDEL